MNERLQGNMNERLQGMKKHVMTLSSVVSLVKNVPFNPQMQLDSSWRAQESP